MVLHPWSLSLENHIWVFLIKVFHVNMILYESHWAVWIWFTVLIQYTRSSDLQVAEEILNRVIWTADALSDILTATSFLLATSRMTLMRTNLKSSSWVCCLGKQNFKPYVQKVENLITRMSPLLAAYGNVVELRINTKGVGGKLPNFGFVVFDDSDPVQRILGAKVEGACIIIS